MVGGQLVFLSRLLGTSSFWICQDYHTHVGLNSCNSLRGLCQYIFTECHKSVSRTCLLEGISIFDPRTNGATPCFLQISPYWYTWTHLSSFFSIRSKIMCAVFYVVSVCFWQQNSTPLCINSKILECLQNCFW